MRTTNVLLWLTVVAFPSAAVAETCPPTAVVSGPKALVRSLTQALMARGVQIEPAGLPPGACPALDVAVAPAAAGLQVRITDPWGRRADRALANVLTAATLIEVWARMDLLASETSTAAAVVDPTPPVGAEEPAMVAAATATAAVAAPAAAAPAAEELAVESTKDELAAQTSRDPPHDLALEPSTLLLDVAGEVGVARDRRVWSGSAVSACMRIGFACVGALGRFAFSRGGDYRIDGLGLVTVPIALGRFTLSPGVGVGAGVELERNQGRGGPDGSLDLRVEGRLGLGFRITDTLHAELGASASTSPSFHGRGHGSLLGGADDTIVRASLGIMWGSP